MADRFIEQGGIELERGVGDYSRAMWVTPPGLKLTQILTGTAGTAGTPVLINGGSQFQVGGEDIYPDMIEIYSSSQLAIAVGTVAGTADTNRLIIPAATGWLRPVRNPHDLGVVEPSGGTAGVTYMLAVYKF